MKKGFLVVLLAVAMALWVVNVAAYDIQDVDGYGWTANPVAWTNDTGVMENIYGPALDLNAGANGLTLYHCNGIIRGPAQALPGADQQILASAINLFTNKFNAQIAREDLDNGKAITQKVYTGKSGAVEHKDIAISLLSGQNSINATKMTTRRDTSEAAANAIPALTEVANILRMPNNLSTAYTLAAINNIADADAIENRNRVAFVLNL